MCLLVRPAGKLGRQSISAELLQPAELVSGVICQVAVEPELAALLANFLYSNEGGQPCIPWRFAETCQSSSM